MATTVAAGEEASAAVYSDLFPNGASVFGTGLPIRFGDGGEKRSERAERRRGEVSREF